MSEIEELTRMVERLVVEVADAEKAVRDAEFRVDDLDCELDDVRAELFRARHALLGRVNQPWLPS